MRTPVPYARYFEIGLLCISALGTAAWSKERPSLVARGTLVERGAYLATVGGCNDCHSPKIFGPNGPEIDKARMLSGYPAKVKLPDVPAGALGPQQWGALATNDLTGWAGPWGVSFAANLTPDGTGLRDWTADTFIRAMRTGRHAGVGRPILPPMPWQEYGRMSDEDLRALFAYLKSLPPVSNIVPSPRPPAGAPRH